MGRNLTNYTDQFLNHFFNIYRIYDDISEFATSTSRFLKMRIFFLKVVRDVILSIMNISANFESSKIIRKSVQICPIFSNANVQICPMDPINPFISVNHVPMEVDTDV